MGDFLNSWYGIAIILAFDLVAVLAVICITYRWFFKRVFDVLVSGVCLALTSPLFLAVFIRGKKFQKTHEGGIESLFEKEIRVGKKEKILCLNRFASRDKDGELLGRYGRWLEEYKLYNLPRLLDVFLGKLSFIGVKALPRSDAEFVEDEVEKDRFLVRPGLVNPLILTGDEEVTYEEMLLSDRKYAWGFSFFMDVKVFFAWLLKKIRGEDDSYMGETRKESYAENLLKDDRITKDDYDAAMELDERLD